MTVINRTSRRWSFGLALLVVACQSSSAAASVILSAGAPTVLSGDYFSYTISAIGTAGEVINSISDPSLTINTGLGAHQVWSPVADLKTHTRQSQMDMGGLWSDTWLPYDTYFFFTNANSLKIGNGAITESRTGTGATLPSNGLGTPVTGFGGINTTGGSVSYAFTAGGGLQGTSVPFMQLVTRNGDRSNLSLTVGTTTGTSSPASLSIGCPLCSVIINGANINNVNANNPGVVSHTFTGAANFPSEPLTWGGLTRVNPTVQPIPAIPATWDPATQKFSWNTVGSPLGQYTWYVEASTGGYTGAGFIYVNITQVPEPAAASLLGLTTLVGLAIRRRS